MSHVCSHLNSQSVQALLCLRSWSLAGMVKDKDVLKVAVLPDVDRDEKMELEDGWDSLKRYTMEVPKFR